MEITEMLDELKSKARRDENLRAELLETRKDAQPLSAFCQKCRELGYEIYEIGSSSPPEKNFMPPCAEAPMAAGKILRCWKVRMIFTSYFSRDWSKL